MLGNNGDRRDKIFVHDGSNSRAVSTVKSVPRDVTPPVEGEQMFDVDMEMRYSEAYTKNSDAPRPRTCGPYSDTRAGKLGVNLPLSGNTLQDRWNNEKAVREILGKPPKCVMANKLHFNFYTRFYVVTCDRDKKGSFHLQTEYMREGACYSNVSQVFESRAEADLAIEQAQKAVLWLFRYYKPGVFFDEATGRFYSRK